MGKKSRSKAAKSAAGRSGETGGTGAGARAVSIGKQRCVSCLALIKDVSKGHQCPGCCSSLYCWRCEKKLFDACPNGRGCAQPMRRCHHCTSGRSLSSLVEQLRWDDLNRNPPPTEEHVELFEKYLAYNDTNETKWSADIIPFQVCSGDGCKVSECRRCFTDPSGVYSLMGCVICSGNATCSGCLLAFDGRLNSAIMKAERRSLLVTTGSKADKFKEIRSIFRVDIADILVACFCKGCKFVACIECLDDDSFDRFLAYAFSDGTRGFRCNTCYSKPCTNPNCPKEPGVPTKRCGGCHLDRYCSVECQAAAYPDHVARCKKIQEKRAATEKQAG